MNQPPSFPDLIRRLRDGDDQAREELIRTYEPAIRRVAHQLLRRRLRRLVSSLDVVQSVLRSFLADLAAGKHAPDDPQRPGEGPERLGKLLKEMARHKVADYARRETAEKRGGKMSNVGPDGGQTVLTPRPPPDQEAMEKEEAEQAKKLAQKILEALSADEQLLWVLREQDLEWAAVADKVGSSPDACRKKLERAFDRVVCQLGLKASDRD